MNNNEIVFVTGNANKLKEVQSILTQDVDSNDKTIHLVNEALDLEELQDTDLKAIALAKGKQAVAALGEGKPVFVEDTALSFDEFNGLPGAYIKWFLKSMGLDKIVKMLEPFENKKAEAVTTICFADSQGEYHFFQGITKGRICLLYTSRCV